MKTHPSLILQVRTLLSRLERISADSPWAHQASGIRAALARHLTLKDPSQAEITTLLDQGFEVLERAAGEIPDEAAGTRPH